MAMYRRRRQGKRAPRRRTARRTYGRRRVRKPVMRTSRYARRASGPARRPARHYHSEEVTLLDFDNKLLNFGGSPSDRKSTWTQMTLVENSTQGGNNDQRIGRHIYIHGFRFSLQLRTIIPDTLSKWQNGYIHFALVQQNDLDVPTSPANYQQPTFSSPIGTSANDVNNIVLYDNSQCTRSDIAVAKLKNPDWRVITHRKFFLGKTTAIQNEQVERDIQFYIPIKKTMQFSSGADTRGTKPFNIITWYVPTNSELDANTRFINAWCHYVTYFKPKL